MLFEIVSKCIRRRQSIRSAGISTVADKDFAAQKGPCREHDSLGCIIRMGSGLHAADPAVLYDQICHFPLFHIQVRLLLDRFFHFCVIAMFVSLRAQGMHRRSLCSVQHFALYESLVDIDSHFTAKRIDL